MDQNETKTTREVLPQFYRNKLLDQLNNIRQWNKFVNEYITQFNNYMMRCSIRENKVMTLHRFYKGLNNNFRKNVRLIGAFTLDQAYTVV